MAVAAVLIPDSLIPDSLIPDSLIPDSVSPPPTPTPSAPAPAPAQPKPTPTGKKMPVLVQKNGSTGPPGRPPAKSAASWQAYCEAYRQRYATEPVENSKARSLLCQLVDRLGAEEAPKVAGFYVRHNGAWYVKNLHQLDHLIRDAEKLRTEWATGSTMTDTKARQTDKTQAAANVWGALIAEQETKERAVHE